MFGSFTRIGMFSRLGLPFTSWHWSTGTKLAVGTPRLKRKDVVGRALVEPGWDLVRDTQSVAACGGRLLHLFGQVMSFDGAPMPDVDVEIWQTEIDVLEPAFSGFGALKTDRFGGYRFRTVLPRGDAACPPYIDARLTPPRGRVLTTRLYLMDDPRNEKDWHFAALGPSRQAAVTLDPVDRADGELEAGFNFVI